MVQVNYTGEALWQRIERAVEKVKDRLRRVCGALESAGIAYAVVGGNAVQFWVAQVDESVVRNTRDVDIILNRTDLPRAIEALESIGFIYRHSAGVTKFLDGPQAKARDAVHVVFAGEKVHEDYPQAVPGIETCEQMPQARTLPLRELVEMKLTSFRDKDRVHLRDLMEVGPVDGSWLEILPPVLRDRLQCLIDDPNGQRTKKPARAGLSRTDFSVSIW